MYQITWGMGKDSTLNNILFWYTLQMNVRC